MKNCVALLATAMLTGLVATAPADAAEVIVNTVAPLPSSTSWGTIPGEDVNGTAMVTSTVARSGNGSLELKGDRTRAQLGIQYNPFRTNLGTFSDVTGLTFDWRIAGDSISNLNADYTPALRLLIQDSSGAGKELIWEGAYNGTYGNTARDTWYTSSVNDKFYITGGNVNAGQTIAQWAGQLTGASVLGFSVGDGSSAGLGYHAFVDDVTFTKGGVSTAYNFESGMTTGAVPEPATWALMIIGMGAVGYAMRRRRRVITRISYAV